MKKVQFHHQHGFGLIEIMAVLAIIAFLALEVLPKITDANRNDQKTRLMNDIALLYKGATSWRGRRPVFTGINCNALVTDEYIEVNWPNCNNVNPVNGNYVVAPNASDPNNLNIQATGLENSMCSQLARTLETDVVSATCASGTLTVVLNG